MVLNEEFEVTMEDGTEVKALTGSFQTFNPTAQTPGTTAQTPGNKAPTPGDDGS
jgi:hypothetical protein